MNRQFAIDRINHARTCVQRAIEDWNGADLTQVAAVQKLLEESLAELDQVPDRLRGTGAGVDRDLHSRVSGLKQDIVCLVRMIDTCSAFYRGLAVRLGDCAPAYTAAGEIVAGTNVETRGLQG